MSADEILAGVPLDNVGGLVKGNDIFDVWLDSGVTWHNVVSQDPELEQTAVADLYLEGLDQGWMLIIAIFWQFFGNFLQFFGNFLAFFGNFLAIFWQFFTETVLLSSEITLLKFKIS
jgi:hypothetical protein